MSSKLLLFVAALVCLAVAAVSLYRLIFWFPLTIAGTAVGQVASFFAFVIFAALSLILFRSGKLQG